MVVKIPKIDDIPEKDRTPLVLMLLELLNALYEENQALRDEIARLKEKDCRTHLAYGIGNVNNIDSLLGTPAPWLTYEKFTSLASVGAEYLAGYGGINPPTMVPWSINHEVMRAFQMDSSIDVEIIVNKVNLDITALGQLQGMSQYAKSGYIRTGVHLKF